LVDLRQYLRDFVRRVGGIVGRDGGDQEDNQSQQTDGYHVVADDSVVSHESVPVES